ncbi:hypothetical protein [Bradyrhizobium erythrophlei]|uniref:Uncharacterized protein n=1 Tax=Bradyrhizobium erythrophlei TaxID=1437360 RepID=A0A1M7UV71_9BRAD|nr:hypothetical protein [Bradyrhizobium erythrophlei]SHN86931.1 hypothetical protein SAMN05444170_6924 [Bradyrhizobium erythrophlei]
MDAEAAKPATADTVNGLRKSEQLGSRLICRNSETSSRKQDKPPGIVATIRKGNRNAVVVSVKEDGQHPLLDIRQHEPNGLQELKPTRSGISNIDKVMARELVTALLKFVAGCRT